MKSGTLIIVLICMILSTIDAQINFTPPVPRFVYSDIESVAIGDVNNDGLNDAIMATSGVFHPENDNCIHVYLQQPDGNMATVSDKYHFSKTSGNSIMVQVADANNNGRNDVIFTFGDSLRIIYQNSAGILDQVCTMYSGKYSGGMDTGDLNNDGLIDIAVIHRSDKFIKVFYQLPDGGFQPVEYDINHGGRGQLEINDMNGDGLADIIYIPGLSTGKTVNIIYQDPVNGIHSDPVTYAFQHEDIRTFNGFATGDLNNDGRNDLVGTLGGNTAWIAIIYQNEDGMLGDATYLESHDIPTPVKISDLNCNGKNEIVVGHRAWNSFSVWEQDESGSFFDYKLFLGVHYADPYGLAVGDMNNDLRKDILAIHGYPTGNLIYNTSTPIGTMPYDTLLKITARYSDTLNSFKDSSRVTFTSRIGDCLIESTYKIQTTTFDIYETLYGDTLFPRSFELCGMTHADTLKSPFQNYSYIYTSVIDSILISADTLVENIIITSTTITYDTLGVVPSTLLDIIEMLSYHYIAGNLYLYVDSLLIRTYIIDTEYLETISSAYNGFKCGIAISDTCTQQTILNNTIVVASDTTRISRTVYAYPLDIAQQKEFSGIRAFPNPAHSDFHLEIPEEYLHEVPFKVSIFSTDGKLRKKLSLKELKTPINASDLPAGVYLIIIEGKSHTGACKIILTI